MLLLLSLLSRRPMVASAAYGQAKARVEAFAMDLCSGSFRSSVRAGCAAFSRPPDGVCPLRLLRLSLSLPTDVRHPFQPRTRRRMQICSARPPVPPVRTCLVFHNGSPRSLPHGRRGVCHATLNKGDREM